MLDRTLRPRLLEDFHGQPQATEKLRIAIDGARSRNEPLDHVIFHGPAGLGKTTLANIIANEMGSRCIMLAAPALESVTQMVKIITPIRYRDVLFIDEIHRLRIELEEFLYSAIEDFDIPYPLPDGRVISIPLAPFTLAGGTTRAGALTKPLRQRFGIDVALDYYADDALANILRREATKTGVSADDDAIQLLASRARGTPRVAKNLFRRTIDYAASKRLSVCLEAAAGALAMEGIDESGLNGIDRSYLDCLSRLFNGGPAGVRAIAASLERDWQTLEETVEPYLIRKGYVVRTPRGRKLVNHSPKAEMEYL